MKTETRDRIVEVARDLFLKQGYGGTGIAQILKGADAGSGSLYYFFPTKEDLLLAVLDWYRANLCPEVVQPVFDRIRDPIERIFGILDGYRQMLLWGEYELGCPIGNLALELNNSHPAVRKRLAELFDDWCAVVRQCLDEAAGRLPPNTDTARLAQYVLVTMEGAVMLARSYRSIEPYLTAVGFLRDHFDRLLRDGTTWSAPRAQEPGKLGNSKPV